MPILRDGMRRRVRPFGIQHNEQMVGDRPGQRIPCAQVRREGDLIVRLCILNADRRRSHQEAEPLSGDELRFLRGLLLLNGRNSRAVLAFHPRRWSRYIKGVYRLNQTVDAWRGAMASLYLLRMADLRQNFHHSLRETGIHQADAYLDKKGEVQGGRRKASGRLDCMMVQGIHVIKMRTLRLGCPSQTRSASPPWPTVAESASTHRAGLS